MDDTSKAMGSARRPAFGDALRGRRSIDQCSGAHDRSTRQGSPRLWPYDEHVGQESAVAKLVASCTRRRARRSTSSPSRRLERAGSSEALGSMRFCSPTRMRCSKRSRLLTLRPRRSPRSGEGIGLALVAAMQVLPPKQRAVLVLREALGWSAARSRPCSRTVFPPSTVRCSAPARTWRTNERTAGSSAPMPRPGERPASESCAASLRPGRRSTSTRSSRCSPTTR